MQKITISLPVEEYSIIEFSLDEKPGIMTVNAALKDFEHKNIFAWHLSVIVIYNDHVKDNMPSKAEQELLCKFEETLDENIKKNNNAVFLASITHNGSRELIWRVYNPELPNDFLHELIEKEDHPRPFEFTLDQDIAWTKARWPLDSLDGELVDDEV